MVKDTWGQEIKNGDFVVSASKSDADMIMGVMKDVQTQMRVKIYKGRDGGWKPATKAVRMYTLTRTLKLADEMIARQNPDLFDVMNDVREKLQLPTTRELKDQVNAKDTLQRMLENKLS